MKFINRFLGAIILFTVFTNCVSTKNNQLPTSKIIVVYSQKYRGGVKGTPNGINYKILFIAPVNSSEFKALGFWIDNKFAPVQAYQDKIGVNKLIFNKNDTICVAANFIQTEKGYVFPDSTQVLNKPSEFNEKVLLAYKIKNKIQYTASSRIIDLEEQLRP